MEDILTDGITLVDDPTNQISEASSSNQTSEASSSNQISEASSSNQTSEASSSSQTSEAPSNQTSPALTVPEYPFMLNLCGRCAFPWLLVWSLVQLSIYLNKLYHDSEAVSTYFADRNFNYCIVSAACLFVPVLVYMMYSIAAVYVENQEDPGPKKVGTGLVHGLLLVPWQIKGRVDVLQFSAEKVCEYRRLEPEELGAMFEFQMKAAKLNFFGNFYAGFTQLVLQLYIIIVALEERQSYTVFTGEMIASGLTLLSMIFAVLRPDDGIMTGSLSVTGWMSIIVSRSLAIAMAARAIYGWMSLICLAHGLVMSVWVTSIAIRTYDESSLGKKRILALYLLVFTVFGLPSLTYWPIMFELKKNKNPCKFLAILLLENLLFVFLWVRFWKNDPWHDYDYILLGVVAGCFVLGSLCILGYIYIKPKFTEDVVHIDMKATNKFLYGMHFVFYDAAFKITLNPDVEAQLKRIRTSGTHSKK